MRHKETTNMVIEGNVVFLRPQPNTGINVVDPRGVLRPDDIILRTEKENLALIADKLKTRILQTFFEASSGLTERTFLGNNVIIIDSFSHHSKRWIWEMDFRRSKIHRLIRQVSDKNKSLGSVEDKAIFTTGKNLIFRSSLITDIDPIQPFQREMLIEAKGNLEAVWKTKRLIADFSRDLKPFNAY